MVEIPFYHHYFKEDPTTEVLGFLFEKENIHLSERPCLCKTDIVKLPPLVLIHGARKIEDICYDRLNDYIMKNPQTQFFILTSGLAMGQAGVDQLTTRVGAYKNYVPWTGFNTRECFNEIVKLAKDRIL